MTILERTNWSLSDCKKIRWLLNWFPTELYAFLPPTFPLSRLYWEKYQLNEWKKLLDSDYLLCKMTHFFISFAKNFPSDHSLQCKYTNLLFKEVRKTRQQDLYTICGAVRMGHWQPFSCYLSTFRCLMALNTITALMAVKFIPLVHTSSWNLSVCICLLNLSTWMSNRRQAQQVKDKISDFCLQNSFFYNSIIPSYS